MDELATIYNYKRLLNKAEDAGFEVILSTYRGLLLELNRKHPAYNEGSCLMKFSSVMEAIAFLEGWVQSRTYLQFEK